MALPDVGEVSAASWSSAVLFRDGSSTILSSSSRSDDDGFRSEHVAEVAIADPSRKTVAAASSSSGSLSFRVSIDDVSAIVISFSLGWIDDTWVRCEMTGVGSENETQSSFGVIGADLSTSSRTRSDSRGGHSSGMGLVGRNVGLDNDNGETGPRPGETKEETGDNGGEEGGNGDGDWVRPDRSCTI